MRQLNAASAFAQAAETNEKLVIHPAILAWFKARGRGWQNEINGVLSFYIDTSQRMEHDFSPDPDTPAN